MIVTHKGWFGICPAYFGDIDGDAPLVVERHFLLTPLFWFSEMMMEFILLFDSNPMWALLITGELDEPRQI